MNEKKYKKAIIDVKGADCTSCVYAIEHVGRKVQGIKDVHVDIRLHEIHVSYTGNPGSLENIVKIVHTLGYDASIRWASVNDS
jgi:copper chaperone CopZ